MAELTIVESLLYATVKLTAISASGAISTGTGFFFRLAETGDQHVPVIVTNKHVVAGADQLMVVCHLSDGEKPSSERVNCNVAIAPGGYIEHPDPAVDLCAVPFAGILSQAIDSAKPIFYKTLDLSLIPNDDDWEYFDALEEVMMIGCPNGLSDQVNNLPIMRRGITASALNRMYEGRNEFMVDMACFPGSSGSPIVIYDRNGFLDRRSNSYNIGAQRLKLVGVLYAGPLITNNGSIVLGRSPRIEVTTMMHLGNAIRSTEIRVLDAEAKKLN